MIFKWFVLQHIAIMCCKAVSLYILSQYNHKLVGDGKICKPLYKHTVRATIASYRSKNIMYIYFVVFFISSLLLFIHTNFCTSCMFFLYISVLCWTLLLNWVWYFLVHGIIFYVCPCRSLSDFFYMYFFTFVWMYMLSLTLACCNGTNISSTVGQQRLFLFYSIFSSIDGRTLTCITFSLYKNSQITIYFEEYWID